MSVTSVKLGALLLTRQVAGRATNTQVCAELASAVSSLKSGNGANLGFSLGISRVGEARAKLGVFGFKLSQSVLKRANGLGDFPLGEAVLDVLRAILVECLQTQQENAFEFGFVFRHGDERGQGRVIIECEDIGVSVNL